MRRPPAARLGEDRGAVPVTETNGIELLIWLTVAYLLLALGFDVLEKQVDAWYDREDGG